MTTRTISLINSIAIGVALVLSCHAHAQPINATQSYTMCPVPGVGDGQGNPIFVPCGNSQTPMAVVVVPQSPVMVTRYSCAPNPITKQVKAFPFCY